ncbi:MAG: hypothetical protein KDC54_06665 [Lewinella sp.]|nr:hypothetical protein [Lewinella sp.]
MRNRYFLFLLKVLAVLLPVCLVYYAPLYEHPDDPAMRSVRRCLWVGFLWYLLLGVLYGFLTH